MRFFTRQFLFITLLLSVALPNYGQTTLTGVTVSGTTIGFNYDPDYQEWLNQLTAQGYSLPTHRCSKIISDMIIGIKADGNWTELDRFWFFAHNGDSDGATVDMIDPSGHAQATKVNSPGWTSKVGFNSNGTSSHLNSNFVLSTDAIKLIQNSAGFGFWMHTGGDAGGAAVLGVTDASGNGLQIFDNTTGTAIRSRLNQGATNNIFTGIPSFQSGKSYGVTRTGSASMDQYINGSINSSHTTASTTLATTQSVYILAINQNGTRISEASSSWRLSVVWLGSGSVNQSEMHSRLSTAMTAIATLP